MAKRSYAVLTGDIVRYSKLTGSESLDLHRLLRAGVEDLRQGFAGALPLEVDVFRGDSWQLLVAKPRLGLRIGLLYRAYIRIHSGALEIDTRVSIGIGEVDYLPTDEIATGRGEAYNLSGQGLDNLPRWQRMALNWRAAGFKEEFFKVMIQWLDFQATHWTQKQAMAVFGALKGWNQEDIGRRWLTGRISQQAVAAHLEKAGWKALSNAVAVFESQWAD